MLLPPIFTDIILSLQDFIFLTFLLYLQVRWNHYLHENNHVSMIGVIHLPLPQGEHLIQLLGIQYFSKHLSITLWVFKNISNASEIDDWR